MNSFLDPENVNLQNLAGGAAVERFDYELDKVLENILDVNMDAKKKRTVVLKVHFTPDSERNAAGIEIECSSSLAPVASHESHIYVGKDVTGKAIAKQNNLKQTTFDDLQKEDDDNVTHIQEVK